MRTLILLSILLLSCAKIKKIPFKKDDRPYVLLISIDGYRWDYTKRYKPKFLSSFERKGATLKSLRPSFPTKTFPNHLSIITGDRPQKHGIVANRFYSPKLKRSYALNDPKSVTDGKFYHSMPFWSLAEKNNIKSATYFWPGSEAEISGERPSYYLKYKHGTPHEQRVEHVYNWFKLPVSERPQFVTLYFHDVDSAGHRYGPDSKEVEMAIHKVDKSIESLHTKLSKLGLPLNTIIVSDHGMMDLSDENFEVIIKDKEDRKFIQSFNVIGSGPLVHMYAKDEVNITSALKAFNLGAKNYKCYTNKNTPKKLAFRNNPSIGDIVCLANYKWSIGTVEKKPIMGSHGWSQYVSNDMHAIFYADGPQFKKAYKMGTRDNIHVFPLLAKILGLKYTHQIDGKISALKDLLK